MIKEENKKYEIPDITINTKRINASIGDILKKRRKELGINQIDLANKLHCSPAVLSRIENGAVDLRISLIIKMCQALKFNFFQLCTEAYNYSYSNFDNYKKIDNYFSKDVANAIKGMINSVSEIKFNTPQQAKSSERDL